MGFALARLTTIAFEPRLAKRVSPRRQLTAGVDTAYYSSTNGLRLLTMTPEVGSNLKLDRQGVLRVAVGLTVARDLADRAPGEKSESRVTPSGNIRLTQLAGRRTTRLESELAATTAYFVDPVLGRGLLRGTAMARLRAVFSREWSAGLELTFSTSLMKHPLLLPGLPPPVNDPTMPGRGYPYETVVAATLPVRWQFSRTFELEGGGRFVDRGPHLRAPGFSLRQRETWLYVLLTATFDFGHRRPATTAQAQ